MTERAVHTEINLDRIPVRSIRDGLHLAVRMAASGDAVWIVNKAGERIGMVVAPADVPARFADRV